MEALIATVNGHRPEIAPETFIAPGAVVAGNVTIRRGTSIWYASVIRAEEEPVVLGERCNVQDASVLHADPGLPAVLGDRVSLGHRALVHGAIVEDDVLIGMGAIVLNGAHIGTGSVIAAGALVPGGMHVPAGSVVMGVPGKVVRDADEQDRAMIASTCQTYLRKREQHRSAWPTAGVDRRRDG